MVLTAPVLFLIFNRPATTQRVFDAIRQAKPSRLFVAADGPRTERIGEKELCEQVRRIIDSVDWNCEVVTLYREENLGCRQAVSSAIDWFFSKVEEGIVLEDDCLPSQSFFGYCQELLEYYRHDTRIMQISGSNFLKTNLDESYFFSKYGPIWGWASWRRAWKCYDVHMANWLFVKQKRLHHVFCFNDNEIKAREKIFDAVYAGVINTWDYQWVFARLIKGGLSITPGVNLITNIGFGNDATHTVSVNDNRNNLERYELDLPLVHPEIVLKNSEIDLKYYEKFIRINTSKEGAFMRVLKTIFAKTSKR